MSLPANHLIVTERHAHAAAVLWLRRDLAVAAPHYQLADLARLDEQLEANLDGLRVAGDAGWQTCLEELRWREPGEVFTAAVLAIESGDGRRVDSVIEAVGDAPELQRAFVSACGWLAAERVAASVDRLWQSGDPQQRLLALAACAVQRRDVGTMISDAIADPYPPLRLRGLRAVGEMARLDLLDQAADALQDDHPLCRLAAACTFVRLTNDDVGLGLVCDAVENRPHDADCVDATDRALQLAVRRLPARDAIGWIQRLGDHPATCRTAVVAAGQLGMTALVPWLLQVMRTAIHARVAGEAFSTITGAGLADNDLEADPPSGFHAGPTDDPDDPDVALDPDENLPWPDPDAVARWWSRHGTSFSSETRYMLGRPIDEAWMRHVLGEGLQRQRIGAAWELAIRNPRSRLFNVCSPAVRQQAELGLKASR